MYEFDPFIEGDDAYQILMELLEVDECFSVYVLSCLYLFSDIIL